MATVAVACCALIAAVLYDGAVRWPRYRSEHHCTATGKTRVDLILIYNVATKTSLPHPMLKHQWRCDGNKELWR